MEQGISHSVSKIEQLFSAYNVRRFSLWAMDICSITMAILVSIMLIGRPENTNIKTIVITITLYIALQTISFATLGCYSSLWRYAGEEEIMSILVAGIISVVPTIILLEMMGIKYSSLFYTVNSIFIMAFTGAVRITYRVVRRIVRTNQVGPHHTRVLIVGGGNAGEMIINELKENPQLGKHPVGIIDDDINKIGRKIHNIKILGPIEDIPKIAKEQNIDEIIISIANISNKKKKAIIQKCKSAKCKVKIIPGVYEIIDGKVDVKKIRDVEIDDLLGREPVKVNLAEMSEYIQHKVVLVTGGGGSIGSELCRQISEFNPKHLIILDNYENNAYAIQQELIRKYGETLHLSTVIASIREKTRMEEIFKEYLPEVVFHAAAHKHVPLMEKSPSEAIKNNIFGTKNVAELAHKYKAKKMVLISTDKAVNPTNIMGATKRAAEMVIQTMNEISETEYVAVRFGNVLGSNGSVIPLFKKQIKEGGPVTITHPDIIRYFMTIPEAVQLVIQAGAMARGGEIFILDMGDPVKIADLARNLITLSGFEPEVDIKIEYVGLRPGEKLYEELLMSEEGIVKTDNEKIFIGQKVDLDIDKVQEHLDLLKMIVNQEDVEFIDKAMRKFVPTYIRPEEANNKEKLNEIAIAN